MSGHPYKDKMEGRAVAHKRYGFADGGAVKNQRRYGGDEDLSGNVYNSDAGANAVGFWAKRQDNPPPPDATGVSVPKGVSAQQKYTKD